MRAGASLLAATAAIVTITLPAPAQVWPDAETTLSIDAGVYRPGWGSSGQYASSGIRLRHSVSPTLFLELEGARSHGEMGHVCFGVQPCPASEQEIVYLTAGGGVQLPVRWVRPYVGVTVGQAEREGAQGWVSSRSLAMGIDGGPIGPVSVRIERRTRWDGAGHSGDWWLASRQISLGASVRVR